MAVFRVRSPAPKELDLVRKVWPHPLQRVRPREPSCVSSKQRKRSMISKDPVPPVNNRPDPQKTILLLALAIAFLVSTVISICAGVLTSASGQSLPQAVMAGGTTWIAFFGVGLPLLRLLLRR